ncbi:MAG TPA: response regulator, partial [Polyangiaceae bacterium]|nr:response regulator [Polyangiaceae bacterium]
MKRATVLVVDDNVELADNLRDVLAGLDGYEIECVVATSGKEAEEQCANLTHALDLAFVDLHLPDVDGLDLVRRLRSRCRHCEVVLITGDATIESAVAAVREGAFAFVLKPFSPQDLLQTANNALTRALLVREREALRFELEESERRHRDVV